MLLKLAFIYEEWSLGIPGPHTGTAFHSLATNGRTVVCEPLHIVSATNHAAEGRSNSYCTYEQQDQRIIAMVVRHLQRPPPIGWLTTPPAPCGHLCITVYGRGSIRVVAPCPRLMVSITKG